MTENIKFSKHDDYLLATISDETITTTRAQEILTQIGTECSSSNSNKVLLDKRSVEKREVPSHKIMELSQNIKEQGLNKIHMAFWCKSHLINKDSNLLSLFTFNNEYIIQHFSDKEEALAWLNTQCNSYQKIKAVDGKY